MAENVVIIGSGPAGWTAGIYAARAQLNPLLFEGAFSQENQDAGMPPMGQLALTTEVENYPGFPVGNLHPFLTSAIDKDRQPFLSPPPENNELLAVTGPDLMLLMKQQAMNLGTRVIEDDVVEVDFESKPFKVSSASGSATESHTIIIATGARANYLGLPSEEKYKNRGVSACAVCDGALPRFRDHPMVVIGGGDSAVEESDYLTKFASVVHLVHRRDQLRASKIMAQRAHDHEKINIIWNHVLDEVLGNDTDGVTGVRLKSTVDSSKQEVEATGLFLAIGHTPNTAFLNGKLDMDEKGYLKWTVPFRTHTSIEGVFAAGDVADATYRQAITAAGTGCMAALDAERLLAAQGL